MDAFLVAWLLIPFIVLGLLLIGFMLSLFAFILVGLPLLVFKYFGWVGLGIFIWVAYTPFSPICAIEYIYRKFKK